MFDFAVNSGPAQAIKTAQRLLGVDHDGTMGAITLQAIQKMAAKEFIDQAT
jgi:lysozyme family protein